MELKVKNHWKSWISISGLGRLWTEEAKKLSDASRNFTISYIVGYIIFSMPVKS